MRLGFAVTLSLAVPLAACASRPAVDPARARQELLENERAFARASVEKGAAAAFRAYLAEDAVELPQGDHEKRGREAIAAGLEGKPGEPTLVLRWEPVDGAVAASGDLGYTWGHYEAEITKPGEPPVVRRGKFMTVWRRDPRTGAWRAIADMGNADPR